MKTLKSKQELDAFIVENNGKKVIIDAYADWCGPCKIMSPVFDNVAAEIGEKGIFAKLDSDILGEELASHGIIVRTIPRFYAISIGDNKMSLLEDMGGTQTKTALVESINKHLA
jgi:thioredoxin 1